MTLTLTNEQFHAALEKFLLNKYDGDQQQADAFLGKLEDELPAIFEDYFGDHYDSIYDLNDTEAIEDYRRKIKKDVILRNKDREAEPRYTDALHWYAIFLRSLANGTTPVPVPGELTTAAESDDDSTDYGQYTPTQHNDDDYAPDTEGLEHQHNLTKKERNPELRRRCIAYYKAKWGGRIHCICCGFDFEETYGEIGKDYIEIHHINPHHLQKGPHKVDPKTELIPLCSNCHSMIHRTGSRDKVWTLEELKEKFKKLNNK